MKTKKQDLRVKCTKMLLEKSLVDLMKEHPISKISVKLLCENADINRSTFYAHYTDQYDLLKQLVKKVIADMEKYTSKDALPRQLAQTLMASNKILIYIANNADLFKTLLSDNGDSTFQNEIMLLVKPKMISDLRQVQNIDARTFEYLQCFVATTFLSIVQKWLKDGMVESTEKMAELISRLLNEGRSSFFDK